jgi:hypothetical protein
MGILSAVIATEANVNHLQPFMLRSGAMVLTHDRRQHQCRYTSVLRYISSWLLLRQRFRLSRMDDGAPEEYQNLVGFEVGWADLSTTFKVQRQIRDLTQKGMEAG